MSTLSLDSEEEPEVSPIEYARANGLSRDYLNEDLWQLQVARLKIKANLALLETVETRLLEFDPGAEPGVEERPTVSRDAALLLASLTREDKVEDMDSLVLSLLHSTSVRPCRNMKVDLPLLRSDPDTDLHDFARRDGFEIKFREVQLPLEVMDDDDNDGLLPPAAYYSDSGDEILQTLAKQQITTTKDALFGLQDAIKATWTEQDAEEWWDVAAGVKRKRTGPITPPLSPRLFPYKPYEPASDDSAYDVPIFSGPASPTKGVLEDLEAEIFMADVPSHRRLQNVDSSSATLAESDDETKLEDLYTSIVSSDSIPFLPSQEQRWKRDDLKVEELLTPQNEPSIAMQKSVRFSDVIEEMRNNETASSFGSPDFECQFFQHVRESARYTTQTMEQEKLIEADSTARIREPVMNFTYAAPPWKLAGECSDLSELCALHKSFIRDTVGQIPQWLESKQKQCKMKWNPFPHNLGEVVHEDFQQDACTWEAFLSPNEEVMDSTFLVWKSPGLMVLKDDEYEEEIQEPFFEKEGPEDMSTLLRKRKVEMEERSSSRTKRLGAPVPPVPRTRPASDPSADEAVLLPGKTCKSGHDGRSGEDEPSMLLGKAFSAANSLSNYLEVRGTKKAKLSGTSHSTKRIMKAPSPPPQRLEIAKQPTVQRPMRKYPYAPAKQSPLPAPTPAAAETGLTSGIGVIVSTTLMKHRQLIKNLESLIPSLVLTERDFSAHNSTAWIQGSVSRSPVKSPLDAEVDLIISPSTGIIITTLQKIRQTPLPGQKANTQIRTRVENVSPRYERLIVLVTEARPDESTAGLDQRDCSAFNEFIAFAIGCCSTTSVQFVGGGEATLSNWLGSIITQRRPTREVELISDETHWELFLRRAGLNPAAAQYILRELRAPDNVNATGTTKSGQYGLAGFVEMGREQRLARFSSLCGSKVLERASDLIDLKWYR